MMTPNRKIKTLALTVAVLLFCAFADAQPKLFRYKADVSKIDSDGVYKIELQPGFIAKSVVKGFYDIRLADEKGRFVAYTIVTNPSDKVKPVFVDFPEVKQAGGTDTATVYIAENKNKDKVDQLWLRLKNTAVSRSASLSGSDDLQHWFAIKEDIQLEDAASGNDTEYDQMLSFPVSNYRYFKVHISNKNKDLVKITRSGIYVSNEPGLQQLSFAMLPPVKLSSKDHDKQTSYYADLGDNYLISNLHLDISSPKFYNRHITVYDVGNGPEQQLYDDTISSSGSKYIAISAKTTKLRIDILNGDDEPLMIKNITAVQLKQFAVSYLQKGHHYYLLTGDSTANEMSYDLSFVHSKPLSQFPVVTHSGTYSNPLFTLPANAPKRDVTRFIWIAMAVVLLLLGLLTWRMVKEINARPKE